MRMGITQLLLVICLTIGATNAEKDVDYSTTAINRVASTERRLVDACYGKHTTGVLNRR